MTSPLAISLYKHALLLAATVTASATLLLGGAPAQAKAPGHTYCFNGICHRVKTLSETAAEIGHHTVLSTSNYDDCSHDRFNPCGLTSSGAVFRAGKPDNAASPIYPDGTILLVRYPATQKSAVVRVDNAGPYYGKRLLDVSRATAEVLGFGKRGVANLEVSVLAAPSKAESTYRKNRVYPAVPGYLGAYASLDTAAVAVAALTTPVGTQAATVVAEYYPQKSAPAMVVGRRSITSNTSNGIETTWLAKAVTFEPAAIEAKLSRKVSARLSRLDEKRHKVRSASAS